jgi:uncharacterized Rossmann fold enzyme
MNDSALTFVTVKWGSKYGADYVNILHDMVRRTLPNDFAFSFVCFTDDTTGILSNIETRPLPPGLNGWWNKLSLFKPGVLEEGARIFYLDLDTAVTGDLGEIITYQGTFAILRDFYRPQGYNSSVMLWRGGFGQAIWQSFEEAGRPDISGGDQVWIERCKPQADILQDLFPGAFASFRDKAQIELPPGAKIVCFHGYPKPPQIKNGWVEKVWKIGGTMSAASATPVETGKAIENVQHAIALSLPWLDQPITPDSARKVCIVGGGVSAGDFIEELKTRQKEGHAVWALNGAFQRLADHGIAADAQVMFAADATNAAYVPEQTQATLFYASQCHPAVFEKAKQSPRRMIVWHPLIDGIRQLIEPRRAVFIGGGDTTGMKAVGLAQMLGFGRIHLYGFDSSFPAGTPPGGGKTENCSSNDEDRRIEVKIDGRSFASSPRLAQQVNNFRMLQQSLKPKGVTLSVHGEGLLPYVARKLAKFNAL